MAIEISPEVAQLIHGIYTDGHYASEAEVIAAAVQMLHERQRLRKDLLVGRTELEGGQRHTADEVFADLRALAKKLDGIGE